MRLLAITMIPCLLAAFWVLQFFPQDSPHDDELAKMDYEVFHRDTLSYWISGFDFHIPLSVRALPKGWKPAERKIKLSQGPKLEEEMTKVRRLVGEYESFYNYASFRQREGRRFNPSGQPQKPMFAFDGRLNRARFEILGDSLGTVYTANIIYEHGVRSVYFYDKGKLQLLVVRKNTPVRTGWDEVSHEIDLDVFYFGGAGLFAKVATLDPIGQGNREREIITSDLSPSLSDSLQRKAQIAYQLASYIARKPGATCQEVIPLRIGTHEEFTAYFNDRMTKEDWALAMRDTGWVPIEFEVDTNGNVTEILDRRLNKKTPRPPDTPFDQAVIRILKTTKWEPAMAGCKPKVGKSSLSAYYIRGRFTGVSTY